MPLNTHRFSETDSSNSVTFGVKGVPVWIILISIGCALLPMTGMKGPSFMGELSRTASVWFFVPAILFSLRYKARESEKIIFLFGLTFLSWVLVSAAVNMPNILTSEFRGRSGLDRLVTTSAVVVYGFMVAIAISRVPKPLVYKFVIVPIMWGVYISALVSAFEITWWYVPGIEPIYKAVVSLVRPGFPHLDFWGRLTSVGFEPHALGLWLGFALPVALWGLSNKAYQPFRGFWPMGLAFVVLMLVLSDGRAGIITSSVVFVVWVTIKLWPKLYPGVYYPARSAVTVVALLFFSVLAFQLLEGNSLGNELVGGNISNLSRYAMNVSAYEMVPEAPIAGRGMGQYAFWSDQYIPPWGWNSYEVRGWLIDAKNGWPSTFSLPGRLLSELGVIGFLVWYVGIYVVLISAINLIYRRLKNKSSSFVELILLLTPFLFFSGLANETFAQMGFWVAVALCLIGLSNTGEGFREK